MDSPSSSFGAFSTRIRNEAIAVRHANLRKSALVEYRVFRDDAVEVENVRGDRVDLLRSQRAWLWIRHGSPRVVPQRCRVGPIAAHGQQRCSAAQAADTACEGGEVVVALTLVAMARSTA